MLLLMSNILIAQGWGQIQKIVPNDRELGDQFGYALAMSGDYAVVGSRFDDLTSSAMGSVYVYKNDGTGNWTEQQKLIAPDKKQFDSFGWSVDIDGDYLIIGCRGQDFNLTNTNFISSAGAAYIFEKDVNDNWNFVQKLIAPNRAFEDVFGESVAISGDYAIIAAPWEDEDINEMNPIPYAGSVYVFERDGSGVWSFKQKLTATVRASNDRFGGNGRISISGNTAIVGVPVDSEDETESNPLSNAGSAYVFERDASGTWNTVQKIVNSDREIGDSFGRAVSIDGNVLIVGADYEDQGGNAAGAVYVFERNGSGTWDETQKLIASNSLPSGRFGTALDIDSNKIIVGNYLRDIGSPGDDGAAYVFENQTGTWSETAFIYDAFNDTSEYFGYAVAISGDFAFAGAYQDSEDDNEINSLASAGAAFIFDINTPNTLSVSETFSDSQFKVFPNPTTSEFIVDLDQYYEQIDIEVYNQLGQLILQKTYHDKQSIFLKFDVPTGSYFVKVNVGLASSVLKIIKQ